MMPLQRQHRLGCQSQLVRDGHADAAIANIEAEIAGVRGGFQLWLLIPAYSPYEERSAYSLKRLKRAAPRTAA